MRFKHRLRIRISNMATYKRNETKNPVFTQCGDVRGQRRSARTLADQKKSNRGLLEVMNLGEKKD